MTQTLNSIQQTIRVQLNRKISNAGLSSNEKIVWKNEKEKLQRDELEEILLDEVVNHCLVYGIPTSAVSNDLILEIIDREGFSPTKG